MNQRGRGKIKSQEKFNNHERLSGTRNKYGEKRELGAESRRRASIALRRLPWQGRSRNLHETREGLCEGVIARGEGGGQSNMTERAYGAEPSRAERVAHGERNAAEGCIDPPAARSRRRRAPRRSNPLAVLSLRRATPNPKRLPRFA